MDRSSCDKSRRSVNERFPSLSFYFLHSLSIREKILVTFRARKTQKRRSFDNYFYARAIRWMIIVRLRGVTGRN